MDNVLNTIKNRCSVRSFLDKDVGEEQIHSMLEAAFAAPSAVDKRPWEFYAVTNKEKLAEIRKAMMFGKYESPLIFIVAYNDHKCLPIKGKSLCISDVSAATENILIEATALGLGSVWCAIWPTEKLQDHIAKILDMPKHIHPYSAIYVGYPDKPGVVKDKWDDKRIHLIK